MSLREEMQGYKPEKQTDTGDFPAFKAKGRFMVDKALLEHKKTDNFEGDIFSIALTMVDHPEFSGRKLWKSFFLDNIAGVKKLANVMFTCGLEIIPKASITDDELYKAELMGNLERAADKFVNMILQVSAWSAKARMFDKDKEVWVTKEPVEYVQQFKILGVAESNDMVATEKSPF